MFFCIDNAHYLSRACVPPTPPFFVLIESALYVARNSCVESSVAAFENIEKIHTALRQAQGTSPRTMR